MGEGGNVQAASAPSGHPISLEDDSSVDVDMDGDGEMDVGGGVDMEAPGS